MKIPAIDISIQICNQHLSSSKAKGTEIEAFLTRYLLILICAHFEEEIEKLIANRAMKTNDPHIVSFIRSSVGQIFRSIKTSEISGLLSKFGEDYKQKFQNNTVGTQEETFYNNIVINRHSTAHNVGSNLTFDELVGHYEKAHKILDYVQAALS